MSVQTAFSAIFRPHSVRLSRPRSLNNLPFPPLSWHSSSVTFAPLIQPHTAQNLREAPGHGIEKQVHSWETSLLVSIYSSHVEPLVVGLAVAAISKLSSEGKLDSHVHVKLESSSLVLIRNDAPLLPDHGHSRSLQGKICTSSHQ